MCVISIMYVMYVTYGIEGHVSEFKFSFVRTTNPTGGQLSLLSMTQERFLCKNDNFWHVRWAQELNWAYRLNVICQGLFTGWIIVAHRAM